MRYVNYIIRDLWYLRTRNNRNMDDGKALELDLNELEEGEIALFKSQTGIEDMEELKRHVEDVITRAHKVFGYRYLTRMLFFKSKFARHPAYKHILELGKSQRNAIFLDIGCGLGHDTRKAVLDGYPVENMVASDLYPEFWSLGHELFKSTPETFPVPFIPGDIFDNSFIPEHKPFLETPATERPSLQSLKSLVPLQGHVSFIHASALFHLFREEPQRQLARKLTSLLSPASGSTIFGVHRGREEARETTNMRGDTVYDHSPESWKKLWSGAEGAEGVFPLEAVEVQADLIQAPHRPGSFMLVWSVKRI